MLQKLFLTTHLAEYYIREDGAVLRVVDGVEALQTISYTNRYPYCRLRVSPLKSQNFKVHLLVAKAFIPNPLDLPEVNHVDGNKKNCAKSNLEWSTRRWNVVHSFKTGLHGEKSSRFHGVSWSRQRPGNGKDKWRSDVMVNGKTVKIGKFLEEVEAARAYNAYVEEHGIDVPLNII